MIKPDSETDLLLPFILHGISQLAYCFPLSALFSITKVNLYQADTVLIFRLGYLKFGFLICLVCLRRIQIVGKIFKTRDYQRYLKIAPYHSGD